MQKNQNPISASWAYACLFFLILAISNVPVVAQAGDPKSEAQVFNLKIWTDRSTYRQGQEVRVHVQLTNISSKEIFVGKDLRTNASPSHLDVYATPLDGRLPSGGVVSAVDGLPPHAFDDFPKAVLNWCFLLPPGYSYGLSTTLRSLVNRSDLTARVYKIRAIYSSFGIDYDVHFNPLLTRPDELTNLLSKSWKGEVESNEIEVRILPAKSKVKGRVGLPK